MNEKINLVEILKDCPKGTNLYSCVNGEVQLFHIDSHLNSDYPVKVIDLDGDIHSYATNGNYYSLSKGECCLFPSKEQRDWSKFKTPIAKFSPKTFKPFDKVLVRYEIGDNWTADIASYFNKEINLLVATGSMGWKYCIPYNDKTKHLVGTTDDCPDYYKWWLNNE